MNDWLKLKTNLPVTVEFTHTDPIPKEHEKYGKSYIYGIKPLPGGEKSWSTTEKAYELIKALHIQKGEPTILLKEEWEGDKTQFRINGKTLHDLSTDRALAKEPEEPIEIGAGLYDRVATLEETVSNMGTWLKAKPWDKVGKI